jgi:pimeloyl-ACP methyl ester carboxylesterase
VTDVKRSIPSAFALLAALHLLPNDAFAQRSFYWPQPGRPTPPLSKSYSVESVTIRSGEGTLAGWVFEPTAPEVVGTVVYCHGNAGNVEHHVGFADFLPAHGFRLLMFDYRGYGASSAGSPTRESTTEDVGAAIDYATDRWGKPWLMGQSLGASLAIAVAGDRPRDVQGVVAVAAFTSYGAIARKVLRQNLLTRPLVVPSYAIVRRGHDPIDAVAQLSPTPILIVHGDNDQLIPPRMGRELFDRAGSPKQFLLVPGAGHNSGWQEMGPQYVSTVVAFLNGERPRDDSVPVMPAAGRPIRSFPRR